MAKQLNPKKGKFGPPQLSIAKEPVTPSGGQKALAVGALLAGVILIVFLVNMLFFDDRLSSPGPLSSNHANFEAECSSCHQNIAGVTPEKCSGCHEKTNDPVGVYSAAAHSLYRSGDPARIRSAGDEEEHQQHCASCHPDHRGRQTPITDVSDEKCMACHDFGGFDRDHPQFEFARSMVPDDSTLLFTHTRHTRFVFELLQKKSGDVFLEKACLSCHVPNPNGMGFGPLDFELHCADCHLTTAGRTPNLPIIDPADSRLPGVETLEMIQRRRGPGTLWAFYTNPNEFSVSPRGVVKSPVYHRDPWIMENLRRIRDILYGAEATLASLYPVAASGTPGSRRESYNDIITVLREYANGLRSRPEPEVQTDLAVIDSFLLVAAGRALRPDAGLPPELLSAGAPNPDLTPNQRQDLEDFTQRLTEPCRICHLVEGSALLQVRGSQRTLMRAEFDHRAHVLERRCLDCHTGIPVESALLKGDTSGVRATDRSSTQNLPGIENCRVCHLPSGASQTCVTCHFMHPNKSMRGDLRLATDRN